MTNATGPRRVGSYGRSSGSPTITDGGALCATLTDPDVMFERYVSGVPIAIKRMCAACPLLAACDAYASTNPVDGIWAGTTRKQRDERNPRLRGKMLSLDVSTEPPYARAGLGAGDA